MDWEQHNRVGQVIMDYYKQIEISPTQEEFELYISGLEEPMRSDFRQKGLIGTKRTLNFQRFYLELHDYSLENFMKENLTPEDFTYWKRTT